ncbi:MAG: PIN domain-containing protein [Cyanobacteria bacterium P01_H01_bin.15]
MDTNIWIYALEGFAEYVAGLTALFKAVDQGKLTTASSELALAEALVKPFESGNLQLPNSYQQAISNRFGVEIVPVSRQILLKAAQLRVTTNLKLPDTIHAAMAVERCCSSFITNNKQF